MSVRERPRFPRRSDLVSLAVVTSHLAFALAPVFLAARVGPSLWLLPLWLWFGLAFHGILNLWHESSHSLVFRDRFGNDVLGRWILAPLIIGDFDTYKRRHWEHHKFLGEEADTKDAYLFDLRGARMLAFLFRCLTLRQAVEKLRNTSAPPSADTSSKVWLVRAAVVHGILVAALFAVAWSGSHDFAGAIVATGAAWGLVFAYGMASLTLFVAVLRTLSEHGLAEDGSPRVGRAALRNFSCGPVERLLMGAYGFAEHATHHREPAVPSYHLRDATDLLVAEGALELKPHAGGYRLRLRQILAG